MVTVPTVTISDLSMGTTYNISIRTVCGSDTTFAYYTTATTQCHLLTTADLLDGKYLLVQQGKKKYFLVIAK